MNRITFLLTLTGGQGQGKAGTVSKQQPPECAKCCVEATVRGLGMSGVEGATVT